MSKAPHASVQSDPAARRGQPTAYWRGAMNPGRPRSNPQQAGGRTMTATASSMPMGIPDDFSDMYTIELPLDTNTDTMQ